MTEGRRHREARPRDTRRAVAALAVGAALLPAALVATAQGAIVSHSTKGIVIASARSAKLGTFLVSGRTVYALRPSSVPCAATCHRYWPEVLLPKGVSHATAGRGVSASKLGTLRRPGGALQVTYAGRALYWFVLDTGPGQVHGDVKDTWGTWSVVVIKSPSATPTTTSLPKPSPTTTTPVTTTTRPATTTTAPAGGGGGGVGF
ncbi:MAG: hypothetical protein KGJ36_01150 [Acidobacteriota bacterium]|nr:hypothetical protein [Acidobacteriota bacterium]